MNPDGAAADTHQNAHGVDLNRMDLVDLSGGDRGLARRYARIAGLRPICLTVLSGVETGWSNHNFPGTTSFVVELPAGALAPRAVARHARAVQAMELGHRSGSATGCDSITPAA
jgi:hypothetical protein